VFLSIILYLALQELLPLSLFGFFPSLTTYQFVQFGSQHSTETAIYKHLQISLFFSSSAFKTPQEPTKGEEVKRTTTPYAS